MATSIAPIAARAGVTVVPSSGEFIYRCANRPGYTYAVTVLARTTAQGPQTWAVYKLAGYSADWAHVEVARAVMYEMVSSMAMNPAWGARYEQQIHDATGAIMEISNRITQETVQRSREATERSIEAVRARQAQIDRISAMRDESFKAQQASSDRIRQKWSDVTLGQIHGCDDLGRCSTIYDDADYHWVDRSGNVVAGPSDGSPPGPQYHPFIPDHP